MAFDSLIATLVMLVASGVVFYAGYHIGMSSGKWVADNAVATSNALIAHHKQAEAFAQDALTHWQKAYEDVNERYAAAAMADFNVVERDRVSLERDRIQTLGQVHAQQAAAHTAAAARGVARGYAGEGDDGSVGNAGQVIANLSRRPRTGPAVAMAPDANAEMFTDQALGVSFPVSVEEREAVQVALEEMVAAAAANEAKEA